MEQNVPTTIAKKIWKIVRVIYFMLRKEISKGKLLADLNMIMKRSKIAGKSAIKSLMFHHHAATSGHRSHHRHVSFPAPLDHYEFSCNNSPAYPNFYLESPVLPGFGPSPIGRRLRVSDSPFPLGNVEEEEDSHVDEAAEEFILNFYKDLRHQNSRACLPYY